MTEQTNDPMDVYGRRLGPELRALADRAIQPFDPVDIAHAVAVGRTRRAASFGADWFRGVRPLIWVILILVAALLLALWAVVLSRPPVPAPFVPGSIAFARDGDLYVASPDGSQPVKMADGEPGSSEISNFAFSPDRLYLAFTQMNDPATGTEALYIASADGTVRSMYSGGGPSGSEPGVGLTFGWAPDSGRLAVYPGKTASEIAIIGIDGKQYEARSLPNGVSMTTIDKQLFASLAWSPDSTWIAIAVHSGGDVSSCVVENDEYSTCYIRLATDGSAAQGASDAMSGYLAWAPDSRVAIAHWWNRSIEIRPSDGSAPMSVTFSAGVRPQDGHGLAWSPDGTRLLAATSMGSFEDRGLLHLIDEDGTKRVVPLADPFTSSDASVTGVAWSIDGQRILFMGTPTQSSSYQAIWSVAVGGGSPTLLVETTGPIFDVAADRP